MESWKNDITSLGSMGRIGWLHSLKLTFSPLKMDGWNTSFLLRWPIFRGENVIFREGTINERWLDFQQMYIWMTNRFESWCVGFVVGVIPKKIQATNGASYHWDQIGNPESMDYPKDQPLCLGETGLPGDILGVARHKTPKPKSTHLGWTFQVTRRLRLDNRYERIGFYSPGVKFPGYAGLTLQNTTFCS